MIDAKLQSGLGRIAENYRQDMNMTGLSVGKVIKVHHFSGTADVQLVNTKDVISSSPENKGQFAARILTQGAWFDESGHQKYWGVVSPIAEGSLVVVAFLDNMKDRPIILGQLHRGDNPENVLPSSYPLNERQPGFHRREALKTLRVFPSMAYSKVDGEGNMEFVTSSKSFFAAYNTSLDTEDYLGDNHNGFDHEHLSETNKRTGKVLESDFEEAKAPMKFLFVHRDSFNNPCKWTKFFLNEKGMFRTTRDSNDGTLSYIEMGDTGAMKIRRQLDDPDHGEGNDFSEVGVEADGTPYITRMTPKGLAKFSLDADGNLQINVPGDVSAYAEGNVNLNGRYVNITERDRQG